MSQRKRNARRFAKLPMSFEDDWNTVLTDHSIFSLHQPDTSTSQDVSLELSTNTLAKFVSADPLEDSGTPSGRRQVMVLRDSDVILAVGKEIRICSLEDARRDRGSKKTHKVLHTPNIQFEVHQLALNPTGKLMAVAGAFQVGVIVLPRPGFTRLVPTTIDCKSAQVGQFHHASDASAPVVKIEWHPWGEAGSTLMVMTSDGKLREYDIAIDPDEPQQVLSFIPDSKNRASYSDDASEREVASFTLGKGNADWGPLTMYAVTKSGDIYSICPYMPMNASIPSSYIHALECFIAAKQEFLSQEPSASTKTFTTLYDYQRKYVSALLKQLPPGTVFPATPRYVLMHPPTTIRNQPRRQGPFLLQPSPRMLECSEGGDATDITYLTFGNRNGEEDDEGETERLGVVFIAYQDGKVDVLLDVEKVEARWEMPTRSDRDLPMLSVYETIDLGLIFNLNRVSDAKSKSLLDLLQGNYPVFLADPVHEDVLYVYHAFGVHSLNLGPMLQSVTLAIRAEDEGEDTSLSAALANAVGTSVKSILDSFSVERLCSYPVVGVAIPNDVYLTYSIFILTSTMRLTVLKLTLKVDFPSQNIPDATTKDLGEQKYLVPPEGPPAYVSLLTDEPYVPPPVLSQTLGLPSNPRLSTSSSGEFMLTPETMRYLGTIYEKFTTQIHAVQLAYRGSEVRRELQKQEFKRQQATCRQLLDLVESLKGRRSALSQYKLNTLIETQKALLKRLDRVLQALMEQASPELSIYETKWFQELKRMKQEVMGTRKYDDGSLIARATALQREYKRLMPELKETMEKEKEWRKKSADANQNIGVSQAFHLGEISNFERLKLTELEDRISMIASKLELRLGSPPSKS